MAGRPSRSRAKPGERVCPYPGCDRRAGYGTATPGEGPCRRHGGRYRATAPQFSQPAIPEPTPTYTSGRIAGDGDGGAIATDADPLTIQRCVYLAARRAGRTPEQAWLLAARAAMPHLGDELGADWWATLDPRQQAWIEDAAARIAARRG
jgi:hypothetical protein